MNEQFYEKLVRNLPIGYSYHRMIFDEYGQPVDYEFLDINSLFEDITGLERSKIIGKRVTQVIPGIENDSFDWISFYGKISITSDDQKFDQFCELLNRWYRVHAISYEKGYFITYFTDITDEKRELENNFNTLMVSNDIVFELDKSYVFKKILLADDDDLFFSSKDKVLGQSLKDVLPESMCELLIPCFEKSLHSKHKESIVYKSPSSIDNRWFKAEINFINAKDGSKFVVSARDITKEKELEHKIEFERKKLNNIIEGTQTGTWEWNIQSGETKVNERWAEILGYTLDEILPISNDTWKKFIHPDDLKIRRNRLKQHFDGETPYYSFEFRMKHKDGHWVWTLDRGKVVSYTESGKPLLMLGTHFDITNRKKLEFELKNERNILKTTLLSIEEGIISVDKGGNIMLLNHVAESLTGCSRIESLGKICSNVFNITLEGSSVNISNQIQSVISSKETIKLAKDTVLISKGNSKYPIEGSIAPILNKEGVVNGAVITFRDITEKKLEKEKILYLSYHDQLTGLYNRRFFEEELSRLDTPRNLPISLIMVDVNGLKLTNDAFGHAAGDQLLQCISGVLRDVCRSDDIVSRVGGDEFSIILPSTDSSSASSLINRIYEAISKKHLNQIVVSASLGYGTKTKPEENINSAFKRAEDKMYKRKLSESKAMREQTLSKIVDLFFMKHSFGKIHSQNVSNLAMMFGKALHLTDIAVKELKTLGALHDIGLIAVDDDILNKSGPLSKREWLQVKRHPEVGYQILKSVNHLVHISECLLSHHERWDGTGYPDKIKGLNIPLYSRILSIAESYDAMVSERLYKKSLSKNEAILELRENAGSQFDPQLTDIFIEKVLKEEDSQ